MPELSQQAGEPCGISPVYFRSQLEKATAPPRPAVTAKEAGRGQLPRSHVPAPGRGGGSWMGRAAPGALREEGHLPTPHTDPGCRAGRLATRRGAQMVARWSAWPRGPTTSHGKGGPAQCLRPRGNTRVRVHAHTHTHTHDKVLHPDTDLGEKPSPRVRGRENRSWAAGDRCVPGTH